MSAPATRGQRRAIIALLTLVVLLVVFLQLVALHEGTAMARGIAGMATGLIVIWIFIGGSLMRRWQGGFRRLSNRIPLGWRTRFVLSCIVLACLEEAVAVSLTNAAPLFGARVGEAFITASANWVDVVVFHSVVVFVPMFIALSWVLGRRDLSPFATFIAFGIVGTLGEVIFAGRVDALLGFPMWVFVYGLMVWLPATALPPAAERGARPARWYHAVLAAPVVFLLSLPMVAPIVWVIGDLLQHPSIHFVPQ